MCVCVCVCCCQQLPRYANTPAAANACEKTPSLHHFLFFGADQNGQRMKV